MIQKKNHAYKTFLKNGQPDDKIVEKMYSEPDKLHFKIYRKC